LSIIIVVSKVSICCIDFIGVIDRLPEAEAALTKSEKVLNELSGMPLVIDDDIERWTIKLSLAIGRYVSPVQKTTDLSGIFICLLWK